MAVTIPSKKARIFKDFDLSFTKHPDTDDVSKKLDENAVKQALRNLILTRNFERPFNSALGSPVRALLFEPAGPMLNNTLTRVITDLVNAYEPRVTIININIISDPDNNTVNLTIYFRILNSTEPIKLDIILERTR